MGLGHSPSVVTSGLVLALDAGNIKSYPGSGSSWTDLSGNSNTGTLTNGPTYSSSNGGSIVFDGTNDYISLGTSSSINAASTTFTWSCWYKSNSISAAQLLFSNVPASLANGWSPQIYGSKFLLQVFPSQTYAYANTVLSNSAWYNLAVTYNSGAVVYYLNGVADGTASYTFTAATGPTYISSWAYSSSYFINGSVSQVLMYNAVLTAAQVLQNYNALRGRFGL